ncbi:tyrosine-type recombinase/integrase [Methylobacter svalbardensis]|uniref:tyrosine-type recombinase/integrase n=1 Tax=Methylobacter svalbardensis TaxID=3080016 RepID=UPI0030EB1F4F
MKQDTNDQNNQQVPWNKGKLIGQKSPLKLKEIWEIRIRLQMTKNTRELALFNLSIDSKLRGCDLVTLRINDVAQSNRVSSRAIIMQQKTHRPVQFEITEQTRNSLEAWINQAKLKSDHYLFPSRIHNSPHLSTRQYARIVEHWVKSIGLNPAAYGTHTMRRTKATLVYRRTKNLRAVQLLLGHSKLESTVRL